MKTYIGIKAVLAEQMDAETADAQGLIRNSTHLDANTLGYAVTYADGYRSWSPATAFENANREVPHADAAEILFDTIEYLEDRIAGPMAADDLELRASALDSALRIAGISAIRANPHDIVAIARQFYDFLAGAPVAPVEPPRAAGANVDFNEMLECTDGSLWAQAFLDRHFADTLSLPELTQLLTHWFANAIEAGRANGYKEALFTDEPVVDESKYPAWAQEPAPLPEFAQVDDPRLGQEAAQVAEPTRLDFDFYPVTGNAESEAAWHQSQAEDRPDSNRPLSDEPVGDAPEGGDVELPAFEQRVPGSGEAGYDDKI
jgi:hypothetical protein